MQLGMACSGAPLSQTSRECIRFILAVAGVISAFLPNAAQAQSCYINGSFSMNFGLVTGSGRAASSSVNYTCSPDYSNAQNTLYYQVCLYIGAGSSSAGESRRRMTNYNGSYLYYDLFSDPIHSQLIGAPSSTPVYQMFTAVPPGAPQAVHAPIYGWVYAGQAVSAVHGFEEQHHQGLLRYRFSTSGFPSSADCSVGGTGGGSTSFSSSGVHAYYDNGCTVAATDLNFGQVMPPQSPLHEKSRISVQCSSGTPWKVGLDNGQNFDGSMRRMSGVGGFVKYQLYKDESHTAVWGNDEISMLEGVTDSSGNVVSITVHGEVPSQPNVEVGSFTDTVVVTLHY